MQSASDPLYSPGLKIRQRGNGTPVYYWVAAQCSRKVATYPIKTVLLDDQTTDGGLARAEQCRLHHGELLQWLAEGDFRPLRFTGTVSSLFDHYELHPESPFHQVKYNSQRTYLQSITTLRRAVGSRILAKLTGLDFKRWYDELAKPAKADQRPMTNRAHKAMTMLRLALDWGIVLELPQCQRLDAIISKMRFRSPSPRTSFLTYAQAKTIIEIAHAGGRHSIALAQALQFDLTLRQKDVIGEWIPDRTQPSGYRWANGLTWNHISSDLVLRKITTKTGTEVAFDLRLYPLVMQELERIAPERRVGPLVVSEATGRPYRSARFAKLWRKFATAAGIPASILNMDSRAGGITEATDADAPLELVRHHATHKDVRMTARYSRQTLKKTSEVARIRAAAREQDKNTASERRQNGVSTSNEKKQEEQAHDARGPEESSSAIQAAARLPDREPSQLLLQGRYCGG
jgi:hypothetical protein